MFYVTTSRKPCQTTRRLARWMSLLFGGFSENRGKRSLSEVIERAQLEGFPKVLVIYEKHGNPSELSFLNLDGEWLSPVAVINSAIVPVMQKGSRLSGEFQVQATGEGALEFAKLFGERINEGDRVIDVVLTNSSIGFESDGQKFGPKLSVKFFGKEEKAQKEAASNAVAINVVKKGTAKASPKKGAKGGVKTAE